MNEPETLVDVIGRQAETRGDKVAYVFLQDGEREADSITYGALHARCRRLAKALLAANPSRNPVMLVLPTGIDFVVAFYACSYAGLVAVPAFSPSSNRRNGGRLAAIGANCGAKIVLTRNEDRESVGESTGSSSLCGVAVEDLLEHGDVGSERLPVVRGRDTAFLQYTSGSTAAPKGVVVSHRNLLSNLYLMKEAYGHGDGSDFVQWVPLYHDLGLIGHMMQTAYLGSTCYMMTPEGFIAEPLRWLRALSKFRAKASMAPNFGFDLCVRHVSKARALESGIDLAHWEVAAIGAEPIRASTVDEFSSRFQEVGFRREALFGTYGLAEGTLILVADKHYSERPAIVEVDAAALARGTVEPSRPGSGRPTQRLVSSGKTGVGHDLAVVDPETGRRCPADVVGELWFRGPSVAHGYLGDAAATRAVFANHLEGEGVADGPFLRSGDLGFVLDDRVYLTGRIKELVILNGINYYPQDIEFVAYRSDPALRAGCCAAFSVDDGVRERVVVVQEVSRSAVDDLDGAGLCRTIRREMRDKMSIGLDAVVLIPPSTLPKTTSGKIQRLQARERFLRGELKALYSDVAPAPADASDAAAHRDIANWLLFHLAQTKGRSLTEVTLQDEVSQFLSDSIDVVRMMDALSERIGVELDPVLAFKCKTIEALASAVYGELKRGNVPPSDGSDIVEGSV